MSFQGFLLLASCYKTATLSHIHVRNVDPERNRNMRQSPPYGGGHFSGCAVLKKKLSVANILTCILAVDVLRQSACKASMFCKLGCLSTHLNRDCLNRSTSKQ